MDGIRVTCGECFLTYEIIYHIETFVHINGVYVFTRTMHYVSSITLIDSLELLN